jgi:hypothetical protein
MNIFQLVIDNPATSGQIITSRGNISITNGTTSLGCFIPQKGVVAARRLALGSWPSAWTWTVASASSSTLYRVSITGVDTVTGSIKTWTVNYTSDATATTTEIINAVVALVNKLGGCPATAVATSGTVATITFGANTPNGSVTANLGVTAAAPTLALTGTLGIDTSGVVTGSGTNFDPELPVGSILIVNDGTDFYRGFVSASSSDTAAAVVPFPAAAVATGSTGYAILSNGTWLEANYVLTANSDVALTAGNTYCVYDIDFEIESQAGNGARPDVMKQKAILYVNAEDADLFGSGGFDADLATALGVTF